MKPYADDEVPLVKSRLLQDAEFLNFIASYQLPWLHAALPGLTRGLVSLVLGRQLREVKDIRSFQEVISTYARRLVKHTMTTFTYGGTGNLSADKGYLFVGNHRDIAVDSMLVDFALYLSDMETVRMRAYQPIFRNRWPLEPERCDAAPDAAWRASCLEAVDRTWRNRLVSLATRRDLPCGAPLPPLLSEEQHPRFLAAVSRWQQARGCSAAPE